MIHILIDKTWFGVYGWGHKQNRKGFVKAQSGQYFIMSGFGHNKWYQNGCACHFEWWWSKPQGGRWVLKKSVCNTLDESHIGKTQKRCWVYKDLYLNWQDAFWGIWTPQKQNYVAQNGQYLVRSGLGHDNLNYQTCTHCGF